MKVVGRIISEAERNSFCEHLKNIKKLIVDYKNTIGDYENNAKVGDQTDIESMKTFGDHINSVDDTKEEVCEYISAKGKKALEDGENNDIHSPPKTDPLLVSKIMGPDPLTLVQVKVHVDLIHDWLTKILATQFKYLVHILKNIN